MANIRNSISLQDHMTPVFRSILRSMDSTLRVMKQVDRQANGGVQSKAYQRATRDVQRANNELIRMQNNLKHADSAASKLAGTFGKLGGLKGFGSALGKSFKGLNLQSMASGLYMIKNAISGISKVMETPDALNQAQYRLEQFDTTGATGSQLYNSVYKTALESRADIGATSDLASRILVSGATKGNGAAAIEMAGLLNKASLIGGATQEESKRALLQLSQGLSSGALQGDELRAIREQAPGLTDTLAKGLSSMAEKGLLPEKFLDTTTGDLKQLGADGELTADRIMAAFNEMGDYINETFDKSPKTFGQAVTGISNVWKNWLKQMSTGDNALARLTEKAWDLFEFFASADGESFFQDLGNAINFVVNGIIGLIDWFTSLDNYMLIIKSGLIALATYAIITGISMMISFIMAYWPILLIIGAIWLLVYIILSCGLTIGQVIGGVIGFIAALVMFLWNIIVVAVWFIYDVIVVAVTAVILIIQGILQIVLWVIGTIITAIKALGQVWNTIWNGFQIVVKGVVLGVVKMFAGMADKVLAIIQKIAEGIDWVFGSNLAAAVGGWRDGLDSKVTELETKLNIEGDAKDIVDGWKDFGTDTADLFTNDLNLIDNMGNTISGYGNAISAGDEFFGSGIVNPMDGWNWGMGIGEGIDTSLSTFDPGDTSALGADGGLSEVVGDVGVAGGDLDSVGKINSDVDISDEDIQLLRDIAARDFLVNVQTVTPKANIKFGDVRETADVNKIVEVIEDMVEEQLATSLVVE